MLRSFRWHLSAWGAMVLILAGLPVFVCVALFLTHEEARDIRRELGNLAQSIVAELPGDGQSADPQTLTDIRHHLAFSDRERRIACAVYAKDGSLVLRRGEPAGLEAIDAPNAGEEKRFDWWLEGPETWVYLLRYQDRGYTLILHRTGHEEALERLFIVFLVYLFIMVPLSMLGAWGLTGKVIRPLQRIAATANLVRQGDLRARIENIPQEHAEPRHLIVTLNQTFAQLEQLFSQVSDFSANAAHELRTPLTALRGNLEVCLRRDRTPEEYQAAIAESIAEISQLQRIVETLLLLSRPDAGNQLPREPVDLGMLGTDVVEQLATIAAPARIELRTHFVGDLTVTGMATLLARLVYNLLHNAIKHSPDGETILLQLEERERDVCLTVTNRGPGIPPEHLDRIFDRFYKVEDSSHAGLGLGLALCRWIVDNHHGTIAAESSPGQGATFRVTLPKAPPA